MHKIRTIQAKPNSPLLRVIVGVVAFLLIAIRLGSPFLHTHQFTDSKHAEISAIVHCDACEYESTQAVEPDFAIVLPSAHFENETKIFEIRSVFVSVVHSSLESRGPPSIS